MKRMTKFCGVLLALMLALVMCIPALAAEAESDDKLFSMNLPNGFSAQQSQTDGQYVWMNEDTGESIVLTIAENTDGSNITAFSAIQLEEYEKSISEEATKQYVDAFEGYGIDASTEIVESEIKPLGDYTALYVVLDTTLSVGSESIELYQYTYTVTSVNYIYSLCYTTQDEGQADKLADIVTSFSSLKIMDKLFTSFAKYILYFAIAGVIICAVVVVIIILALNSSKKKKAAQQQFAQQQFAQQQFAQQQYAQQPQTQTYDAAQAQDTVVLMQQTQTGDDESQNNSGDGTQN